MPQPFLSLSRAHYREFLVGICLIRHFPDLNSLILIGFTHLSACTLPALLAYTQPHAEASSPCFLTQGIILTLPTTKEISSNH